MISQNFLECSPAKISKYLMASNLNFTIRFLFLSACEKINWTREITPVPIDRVKRQNLGDCVIMYVIRELINFFFIVRKYVLLLWTDKRWQWSKYRFSISIRSDIISNAISETKFNLNFFTWLKALKCFSSISWNQRGTLSLFDRIF